MEIAPGISSEAWHRLHLDDPSSEDWREAIDILRKRIESRYIQPVDVLIANDECFSSTERRYGFVILAIDSLLIETLQAFQEGVAETEGWCGEAFERFLTEQPPLNSVFTKELALRFYKDYRCGILHQAEIKGNSLVWSVGPVIHVHGDSLIVNRTALHKAIKEYFSAYLEKLADPKNTELREKFRKKMNHICRPNQNFV